MSNIETKYGGLIKNKIYIRRFIDRLGFGANYKGYYFLVYIVDFLLSNHVRSFSKDVYPLVAKVFGVKSSSIERDIRNYMMVDNKEFFSNFEGKLTCRSFVFKIVDMISASLIA